MSAAAFIASVQNVECRTPFSSISEACCKTPKSSSPSRSLLVAMNESAWCFASARMDAMEGRSIAAPLPAIRFIYAERGLGSEMAASGGGERAGGHARWWVHWSVGVPYQSAVLFHPFDDVDRCFGLEEELLCTAPPLLHAVCDLPVVHLDVKIGNLLCLICGGLAWRVCYGHDGVLHPRNQLVENGAVHAEIGKTARRQEVSQVWRLSGAVCTGIGYLSSNLSSKSVRPFRTACTPVPVQ
eukprot:SAG22_NODE_1039_length_5888_cov_4.141302_3_plen_241_part_00